MKIFVRKKHIKLGKRGDCAKCPVALALKAHKRLKVHDVCQSYLKVSILVGKRRKSYSVPPLRRVVRFIDLFDASKPVKPFVFQLKIDDKYLDIF